MNREAFLREAAPFQDHGQSRFFRLEDLPRMIKLPLPVNFDIDRNELMLALPDSFLAAWKARGYSRFSLGDGHLFVPVDVAAELLGHEVGTMLRQLQDDVRDLLKHTNYRIREAKA